MSSRVSQRIDGVSFDLHKVRHSGTVELDAEQADQLALGEVVVSVNVSSVADVQAKADKDGNVARVAVLKTYETVVLDSDLKQLLVERLGLYGSDTMPPPIRITPGERTETQRSAPADILKNGSGFLDAAAAKGLQFDPDSVIAGEPDPVRDADDTTGEIDTEEYAAWLARQAADPAGVPVDDIEDEDFSSGPVERLGQIGMFDDEEDDKQVHSQIKTKDKVLAAFLSSE